jgi:uncharacterized protein with von Willebrand factor type A (vWA) domain
MTKSIMQMADMIIGNTSPVDMTNDIPDSSITEQVSSSPKLDKCPDYSNVEVSDSVREQLLESFNSRNNKSKDDEEDNKNTSSSGQENKYKRLQKKTNISPDEEEDEDETSTAASNALETTNVGSIGVNMATGKKKPNIFKKRKKPLTVALEMATKLQKELKQC